MKRLVLLLIVLGLLITPLLAAAEVRTYTEIVTIKVEDDEYTARKRRNNAPVSRPLSIICAMFILTGPPP